MILEVGVGDRKVAVDSVGVDIQRCKGCDVLASVYFLPFRDGVFTKAVLFEVCEHLENPKQALREVARVSPRVLISVPNVYWFRAIVRWVVKGQRAVSKEHINGWTLPELKNLLGYVGFEVEYVGFFDTHFAGKNLLGFLMRFLPRRVSKQSLFVEAVRI